MYVYVFVCPHASRINVYGIEIIRSLSLSSLKYLFSSNFGYLFWSTFFPFHYFVNMQIMQICFYFSLLKSIRYICGKKEQRINVVIWLLLLLFVPFQSYARFVCHSTHVCYMHICLCVCVFMWIYFFAIYFFVIWFSIFGLYLFFCLFVVVKFCSAYFGWWSFSHFAIKFACNDWAVYACFFQFCSKFSSISIYFSSGNQKCAYFNNWWVLWFATAIRDSFDSPWEEKAIIVKNTLQIIHSSIFITLKDTLHLYLFSIQRIHCDAEYRYEFHVFLLLYVVV